MIITLAPQDLFASYIYIRVNTKKETRGAFDRFGDKINKRGVILFTRNIFGIIAPNLIYILKHLNTS